MIIAIASLQVELEPTQNLRFDNIQPISCYFYHRQFPSAGECRIREITFGFVSGTACGSDFKSQNKQNPKIQEFITN